MFQRLKIVWRLFGVSFMMIALLYSVVVVLVVSILTLKDAYKTSLENEFATKQPHIKITYVQNDLKLSPKEANLEAQRIKKLSLKIAQVSGFSTGKRFFSVLGYKMGGNAQYSGDIKIVGIDPQEMVYDFLSCKFIKRKPFEIKYTPIEFIYNFRSNKLSIFNQALFDSFFPVIESTQRFLLSTKTQHYPLTLAGSFEDYDKTPTLYTTRSYGNFLLGKDKDSIDGFFVNVRDLEDIKQIKQLLERKLSSKRYIITSWLEEKKKQHMMFLLFESLAYLVVFVIVLLAILFILLLLYYAIVKKSYQLSVLYTLGYILKYEIFVSLVGSVIFVDSVLVGFVHEKLHRLVEHFGYDYSVVMEYGSYGIIAFLSLFFVIFSYILIQKSYDLKTKSVF